MLSTGTMDARTTQDISSAPKKKRKQRYMNSRYPASVTVSITASMGQSLLRLCPPGGPFTQSQLLRMIIHGALLAQDPHYARAMSNGGADNA